MRMMEQLMLNFQLQQRILHLLIKILKIKIQKIVQIYLI
jgi:hypothetical protein